jgi:hypothetical protein
MDGGSGIEFAGGEHKRREASSRLQFCSIMYKKDKREKMQNCVNCTLGVVEETWHSSSMRTSKHQRQCGGSLPATEMPAIAGASHFHGVRS